MMSFRGRDMDWSEESATQPIVTITIKERGSWKTTWSAYHLNGIFVNSGANSNGTVHPGGKFLEKR